MPSERGTRVNVNSAREKRGLEAGASSSRYMEK